MPDNISATDSLLACKPIRFGEVTLLLIERVKLQSQSTATHAWIAASKEPAALVVRNSDGIRTIDIGTALSIEQIREKITELDDLMSQ